MAAALGDVEVEHDPTAAPEEIALLKEEAALRAQLEMLNAKQPGESPADIKARKKAAKDTKAAAAAKSKEARALRDARRKEEKRAADEQAKREADERYNASGGMHDLAAGRAAERENRVTDEDAKVMAEMNAYETRRREMIESGELVFTSRKPDAAMVAFCKEIEDMFPGSGYGDMVWSNSMCYSLKELLTCDDDTLGGEQIGMSGAEIAKMKNILAGRV